jgi:hypothetical protein
MCFISKIQIKNYSKIGKNKYVNGIFDFTFDVCKLTADKKIQILAYLVPDYVTVFEKWIHPCPYNVSTIQF